MPGVQRWVDQRGSIPLAGFGYRVPIVLAGEAVEAVVADNLVQIYRHDVLVASHVQRRKPQTTPAVLRQSQRTPRAVTSGIRRFRIPALLRRRHVTVALRPTPSAATRILPQVGGTRAATDRGTGRDRANER